MTTSINIHCCSRAMTSILYTCIVHVKLMRYDVIVGIPLNAIWGGGGVIYYSIPFTELTYFQFLMTSKSLPSTESVSFLMVELRTEVADSIIAIFGGILLCICINHKFSMRFKSGKFGGQTINVSFINPRDFKNIVVGFAAWDGALSCMKINKLAIRQSRCQGGSFSRTLHRGNFPKHTTPGGVCCSWHFTDASLLKWFMSLFIIDFTTPRSNRGSSYKDFAQIV